MSKAQEIVLTKLREGYELRWSRDGESAGLSSNCALFGRGKNQGSFYRVSPATLKALERAGKIRLIERAPLHWTAELADETAATGQARQHARGSTTGIVRRASPEPD